VISWIDDGKVRFRRVGQVWEVDYRTSPDPLPPPQDRFVRAADWNERSGISATAACRGKRREMEARPVEVHRLKRARPLELSITRLRQVQKPSVRGYEHQKLVSVWVALELTSTRELVPGDPEF